MEALLSSVRKDELENSKNSGSDLLIEVNYPPPFIIDSSTLVEAEVRLCMKQFMELLWSYLFRLLIIVLVLLAVLYFQGILMFLSDTYYMKTNRIPLLDRVHELLDGINHPFTPTFCNVTMFIFVWAGILRVVLFTPLIYTLEISLRYIFLFGSAYFLRGFFIYMTTMPSCYQNCEPDLQRRSFFAFFIRIIAGYMGIVTNCTDLIISGHTMFTVTTCILLIENIKYLATKIISILITAFVLFLIIASKYHYTVDVMFGLFFSIMLHYFYYTKIDEFGVYYHNKIFNSKSKAFRNSRTTKIHNSLFAKFIVKMELLEERLILGQKMRALYLLVNSEKDILDPELLKKFNNYVHLFGANESDDLITLYRGTRNMNFYYWKCLYNKIFKRKQKIISI